MGVEQYLSFVFQGFSNFDPRGWEAGVIDSMRYTIPLDLKYWYRSKVLARGQFNGNDLDTEVSFDAEFLFPVFLPFLTGVLF